MLSALLRAGRSLTAGLSGLSTADSILMSYVNVRPLQLPACTPTLAVINRPVNNMPLTVWPASDNRCYVNEGAEVRGASRCKDTRDIYPEVMISATALTVNFPLFAPGRPKWRGGQEAPFSPSTVVRQSRLSRLVASSDESLQSQAQWPESRGQRFSEYYIAPKPSPYFQS